MQTDFYHGLLEGEENLTSTTEATEFAEKNPRRIASVRSVFSVVP
jgi:hypothetical protein